MHIHYIYTHTYAYTYMHTHTYCAYMPRRMYTTIHNSVTFCIFTNTCVVAHMAENIEI